MSKTELIAQARFPFTDNVVMEFIGGSALHGARVGELSDLDIYGIYIEPPHHIIGIDSFEHFISSTADNSRRNTERDVDVTLYSLRKWATLAAKGNPTAINFLFATATETRTHHAWHGIRLNRRLFLSRAAASHYKGFADGQLRRLKGNGTGKHGQRPELTEQHGYDVKAAMQTIRLLFEGIELMSTGHITLPRPLIELDTALLPIRRGEWPLDRVIDLAEALFGDIDTATASSQLPGRVDRETISRLVSDTYLRFWDEHKLSGWTS